MLKLCLFAAVVAVAFGQNKCNNQGANFPKIDLSQVAGISPTRSLLESNGFVHAAKLWGREIYTAGAATMGATAAGTGSNCALSTNTPALTTGADALPQSDRIFYKTWDPYSMSLPNGPFTNPTFQGTDSANANVNEVPAMTAANYPAAQWPTQPITANPLRAYHVYNTATPTVATLGTASTATEPTYTYERNVQGNTYLYVALRITSSITGANNNNHVLVDPDQATLTNAIMATKLRLSLQPANLHINPANSARCRTTTEESSDFILLPEVIFRSNVQYPAMASGHGVTGTGNVRTRLNADGVSPAAANYGVLYGKSSGETWTNPITGSSAEEIAWVRFPIPAWNYYDHAPTPNDSPYSNTYRRICLHMDTNTGSANDADVKRLDHSVDTGLYMAVTMGCANDMADTAVQTGTTTGASIVGTNRQCTAGQALNNYFSVTGGTAGTNDAPLGTPGSQVTTLATSTATAGGLGDIILGQDTADASPATFAAAVAPPHAGLESDDRRRARLKRTQCCGSRGSVVNPLSTTEAPLPNLGQLLGVCIDPTSGDGCCGVKPFDTTMEKCCNKLNSAVEHAGTACTCNTQYGNNDCNRQGANAGGADNSGASDALTSSFGCCAQTMYGNGYNLVPQQSYCYDNVNTLCCSDGNVYDPASNQCCPVNGVQTLDIPCPCSATADCPSVGGRPQDCCRQIFPPLYPENEAPSQGLCSAWANFRNGRQSYQETRCYGSCYSTDFQMCCNGQICNNQYERCCNNTCCNKFTSSCVDGQMGVDSNNFNNFGVYYEVCTSVESLTARRAFFIFILPLALLFATLLSLALVTLLARRATETVFEMTEQTLVLFSVLLVFVGCPFYFSPAYKYGVVVCFTALFAILAAVARKPSLSLALVFVALVAVLFVVNPFGGNFFLGFTSGRNPLAATENNAMDRVSDNLVEHVQRMIAAEDPNAFMPAAGGLPTAQVMASNANRMAREECTKFYDFFQFDNNVRDVFRIENPAIESYGYCSRAWLTTLLVFAAVVILLLLIVLLLAIFSYAKKIIKLDVEEPPVELEIVEEPIPVAAPLAAPAATYMAPAASYVAPIAAAPTYTATMVQQPLIATQPTAYVAPTALA